MKKPEPNMYLIDLQIEDDNPQRMKFVDYFNEFRKEVFGERSPFEYENRFDNVHIISKNMGFIKWLVENDKLNLDEEAEDRSEDNLKRNSDFFTLYGKYDFYESILMLLSIQNDPITFILKILK